MQDIPFLKTIPKILLSLFVFAILSNTTVYADFSAEYGDLLDEYAVFYGDFFDKAVETSDENLFDIISDKTNPTDLIKELNKGNLPFAPADILAKLLKLIFGEISDGIKLMATILAVSVLCSYLSGLNAEFSGSSVSTVAFYVCYIIMVGTTASAFLQIVEYTSASVENIATFVKIFVPAVITLLYTSGAIISASYLEPTVLGIVSVVIPILQSVFIPAIMMSAGLNVVNGISDRFKTDKAIKLINGAIKWGLSLMLTVFVSLTGLKSIASHGADGLSVKMSKFAASNLVPVVGGILSESVETVMSCSIVIKNSVGILGMICLISVSLMPILKVGAMVIIFKTTAAIIEPVSDPKIVACLSGLSNSLAVLFSVLVSVTVMFIIIITILINVGNNAVFIGG